MKSNLKKTEFINWYHSQLDGVLEDGERQEILFRLLEHQGISRIDWAIDKQVEIDKKVWQAYIEDLKKEKPIQYILGYEYFADEKFIVDSNVLIPRPETEELISWIIEEHKNAKILKILEIGTGSGCIAISLKKKLPQAKIIATDISEGALKVARQNAQNLEASIEFIIDDALHSKIAELNFDIMVSNPPYIPIDESDTISQRVKAYEPNLALFTEKKKPLQFYEAILELAQNKLKPNGSLYFEVHEDYAEDVFQLAAKKEKSAEIRKDLYGKARMIKIKEV